MKRKDVPTQPRTEYTLSREEFARLLGIENTEEVTSVYVSAREIQIITHPKENLCHTSYTSSSM
jgi:hypothetical protein